MECSKGEGTADYCTVVKLQVLVHGAGGLVDDGAAGCGAPYLLESLDPTLHDGDLDYGTIRWIAYDLIRNQDTTVPVQFSKGR